MIRHLIVIVAAAAIAGCGNVKSTTTDGAPTDAPPGETADSATTTDGMPDAATEGPVTVTVLSTGDPVPDALVFFHDETGTQVDDAVTDENGMAAKEDMPVGGSVTILRNPNTTIVLESVGGVQVGDDLVFDTLSVSASILPSSAGTININLPQTSVDSYLVESNCRLGAQPTGGPDDDVVLTIRNTCPDTNNIQVVAYGLVGGVRTVAQASTSALGASVNYFSTEAVVDVTLDGPTVGVAAEMDFSIRPLGENGVFDVQGASDVSVPSGSSASETYGYMADIVPRLSSEVSYVDPASAISAYHRFRRTDDFNASAGSDLVLDATDTFPLISSLSVDVAADPLAVVFAAPEALECGSLGPADGIAASVRGFVDEVTAYTWVHLVKGDTPSPIELPRLSAVNQSLYWPRDTFIVHEAVFNAAAFSDRDYDQFRNGASASQSWLTSPLLGNGDSHCLTRAAASP